MQKGDCERAPRRAATRRDVTRAHSVPGAEGRSTEFFCPSHFQGKLGGEFRQGATMEHQPGKKKHPRRILTSEILHTLRPVEVPLNTWLLGAGGLHFFKELHWQVLGQAV